jgi:hypothetical protein
MRDFTKQLIVALNEDDWIIKPRAIKHVKSFLIIDTDDMQPCDVPFRFTWWERMIVKHHVYKLRDRMMLAKLIECRLNPRGPSKYSHENQFLDQ